MPTITIDESLCHQCGTCAGDCLMHLITLNDDGQPVFAAGNESVCISCQHCFSICPTGAIGFDGHTASESMELSELSLPAYEEVESFTRARRSFRHYQQKNVDPALIDKLLKTLAYSPTGVNAQELTFHVVDDIGTMARFAESMTDIAVAAAKEDGSEGKSYFARFATLPREAVIALITRNAPHALIVSAPPDAPCAEADVVIALSYFEFLAQSAGLGTVWWGMLQSITKRCPEVKTLLGIPHDHPYYAMLFGLPAIRFARIPLKENAAVVRRIEL